MFPFGTHNHFPCSCCSSSCHTSGLIAHKSILCLDFSAFGSLVLFQWELVVAFSNSPIQQSWFGPCLSFWAGLLPPSLTLTTFQVTDTDRGCHGPGSAPRTLQVSILCHSSGLLHTCPFTRNPRSCPLLSSDKRSMPLLWEILLDSPRQGCLHPSLWSHSFLDRSVLPCSFA